MKKPEYLGLSDLATIVRTRTVTDPPATGRSLSDIELSEWSMIIKYAIAQQDTSRWFYECVLYSQAALRKTVEVDQKKRGGIPVMKGTRFTVSQALAELAESRGVEEVAKRCALEPNAIRDLLFGLSAAVERPIK